MGISFSCPFGEYAEFENGYEPVLVNPVSPKQTARSVSFNGRNPELTMLKSFGSGKMIVVGSVSFNGRKLETRISFKSPESDVQDNVFDTLNDVKSKETDIQTPRSDYSDKGNPEHEAAIKLQKVYKSFRTRRKLADCAVLVEQSWWKLLDFAELKRSSVSFFDIEKHETAISRWSRARTRAAKVGKGLSKNGKARKLALQHWLEAIDPRHRYGHNLQFYYLKWLHCQSKEPFFYWLDIGEGKEVNLVEKCTRSKLQQQCIKYLGPVERSAYEVVVENGKLLYKQTGEFLDTTGENKDVKWIFVLSTSKILYVGTKKKGTFQHSSFLAGGAAVAAGRLVVESGILKAVWPHSGHYQPTEENFKDFISFLCENKVDISDVKMSPTDEDDLSVHKQNSNHLRKDSTKEDYTEALIETNSEVITDLIKQETTTALQRSKSRTLRSLSRKLTNLETTKPIEESFEIIHNLTTDGYESAVATTTEDEQQEEEEERQEWENENHKDNEVVNIAEEAILRRINSKKETKSFQLGRQLSCKWTTGAGPRIGCVRDYPSELQCYALEEMNLSPRNAGASKSYFFSRSPSGLSRGDSTPISSPLLKANSLPVVGDGWRSGE